MKGKKAANGHKGRAQSALRKVQRVQRVQRLGVNSTKAGHKGLKRAQRGLRLHLQTPLCTLRNLCALHSPGTTQALCTPLHPFFLHLQP